MEEEEQVTSLRKNIGHWIEECRHENREKLEQNIKRLGDIWTRLKRIDHHWQKEVLYLRDVQTAMVDAAKLMMKINPTQNKDETAMSDYEQQRQVSLLLRHILHPVDRIQEQKFPNLRLITEGINEVDGINKMEPFEITSIEHLPEAWRMYKKLMNFEKESPNLPVKSAQLKLESTIKVHERTPVKTYEYLIFVGVLQIFGFDTSVFRFGYQLLKLNMDSIFELYEAHLAKFHDLHGDKQQQTYVFQVALCSIENKETAVQYMSKSMTGRLCHDFRSICGPDDTVNIPALKTKLQNYLPEDSRSDLGSFIYAFESQFRFLQPFTRDKEQHQQDCISATKTFGNICPREVKIMEALDMKKYYPEKLTYDKFITLTSDVNDDVNTKPTSLPELPWYFIKHVIGLDSDTRENCYVTSIQKNDENDSGSESDDDDDHYGIISRIHPLDLEKIIMMCADDFLRQELMDKMIRCQYAVPFIVPTSNSENVVFLWALESVIRSFYHDGQDTTKPLVDIKTPLVSFMNLGEETSWKSRLLNKMLSSQQEMFWHQELAGGQTTQFHFQLHFQI